MDTFGRYAGRRQRPSPPPRRRLAALASLALLAGIGCRSEMYDQPRYKPFAASEFFADGTSARPLVAGTVPAEPPPGRSGSTPVRQYLDDPERYEHLYLGRVDGQLAESFPFEMKKPDLIRGQERYMIFCAPCHGAAGDGRGMIVQREMPAPPAFFGKLPTADTSQAEIVYDDLREAPVGHFFDVITNGHGIMYPYSSRIGPEDRWRITAYIRALQLSQYATIDDLKQISDPNPEEQALLREVGR